MTAKRAEPSTTPTTNARCDHPRSGAPLVRKPAADQRRQERRLCRLGNTGAMTMGHDADSADTLTLWQLAREYPLCGNFLMGAFGGSFPDHQYLAATQPPFYPNADMRREKFQITVLEGDDPAALRPQLAEGSPASAMQGRPNFASPDVLTPDFRASNAIGPACAPGFSSADKQPELDRLAPPAGGRWGPVNVSRRGWCRRSRARVSSTTPFAATDRSCTSSRAAGLKKLPGLVLRGQVHDPGGRPAAGRSDWRVAIRRELIFNYAGP